MDNFTYGDDGDARKEHEDDHESGGCHPRPEPLALAAFTVT
jgi:hypothetical protein